MLTCWDYYNLLFCHFRCILCVHLLRMMSTCFRSIFMPSLQWCNPCIFLSLVVSASRSWSRVLVVTLLLGWNWYIRLLCLIDATIRYMHNLEMFTKDVLLHMLCSIHPCPCLHLYPAVACCYHAANLLNNVCQPVDMKFSFAMCLASDPCTLWNLYCHS